MTPLDVQDHDWPSGGILMLIVAVSGFALLCWYTWDVIGQMRRRREPVTAALPTPVDDLVPRDQLDDLVPRDQLDDALNRLRTEQAAVQRLTLWLDDARGTATLRRYERDAAWRERDDLKAQLDALTLTAPTDA